MKQGQERWREEPGQRAYPDDPAGGVANSVPVREGFVEQVGHDGLRFAGAVSRRPEQQGRRPEVVSGRYGRR